MEKIVVIGLGLIGGSLALDLKQRIECEVYGIDQNPEHIKKAKELGIINDEISFSEIKNASVVIIAVPVDIIPKVAKEVSFTFLRSISVKWVWANPIGYSTSSANSILTSST